MSDSEKTLPNRSDLITPEGEQALRDEYDFLWRKERPKVTQEVSDAEKWGDRSKNAKSFYGKRLLLQFDSRFLFLLKLIELVFVLVRIPADTSKVFFGAWIELEDLDGELYRYRIVGADEIDLPRGYISIDAPLARGLMGKSLDDEVVVTLPKGKVSYDVVSVTYQRPNWDTGPSAAGQPAWVK